jgi:peroxiredoxin Q/BCP
MRRLFVLPVLAAAMITTASAHKGHPELHVGDPAPAFSLQGSDGKIHRLEDHVGKRAVVIAWFRKAFTGG